MPAAHADRAASENGREVSTNASAVMRSRSERAQRLLVLTYHFPPDGAVGGLRWAGLSKYLAKLGWEVHVVTPGVGRDSPAVPGVHRHECARRRTLNDRYATFAARVRGGAVHGRDNGPVATAPTAAGPTIGARWLGALRMVARIALAFPDNGRGWIFRAASTAGALLDEMEFDAVISSGPPHSVHFAALLATRGRAIPHIVDMRDPWRGANRDWPAYGMSSRWLHPLIRPLEGFLFRRVQNVVVNTSEFADDLRRSQPQLAVTHISNGTDVESLPKRNDVRFDGFSIAYVGTLYAGRRFSTVLSALRSISTSRPRDIAQLKLRIAGAMDGLQTDQFRAELEALGLSELVTLYGMVPRADALDLLRRSQLALVLAQEQPTQVPAKLYECVGLGIPTLVLTEPGSAADREARRIGAIVADSGDVAAVEAVLNRLLNGQLPAAMEPAAAVSYDALAHDVDRVIRHVMELETPPGRRSAPRPANASRTGEAVAARQICRAATTTDP